AGRVGTDAHRQLAREVGARSITLVRDAQNLVPLRPGARVLHVTYTESGRGASGGPFNGALASGGVSVDHVRVGPSTSAATFASLRERAASADVVVASIVVSPVQYRPLGIGGGFGAWVEGLAASGKPVVAVSLGSPYLLGSFPSVPAYLLGWSNAGASESAAARALLGAAPIRGRLPVALPPYHRVGEGITREARN
ncbi:MAG TPA: glycoside hydrolase family 3 C-terminal domain-containing protein, partial [Longimicrobium sp.]|nr:glycoside hydrolase family 3 C-terminal domain-containing protein [Longimicrobium sp.]